MVRSLGEMGSQKEQVHMCVWEVGLEGGRLWMCVESEDAVSTSSGDVQRALCSNVERELVFIKNHETSVKTLLAEFLSSRKACYANKQEAYAPVEGVARALELGFICKVHT